MAKYEDEPTPRFWHQAFLHNEEVYVRGGQTDDFESERDTLETTLKHFDPIREVWQGIKTEGIPHPGLTQVAMVCVGGILYLYGTHERKVLSQLNLETLVWSQLWDTLEKDDGKTPMIKAAAGMVPFSGGHLALFAGYACRPSGPVQPGSEWTPNPYEKSKGWTNEFHLFNICKSKRQRLCDSLRFNINILICRNVGNSYFQRDKTTSMFRLLSKWGYSQQGCPFWRVSA